MDYVLSKMCHFLIENNTNELQKLKKICKQQNLNFNKLLKKAKNYLKNLTNQAQTFGYNIDFESFFNLLENYIAIKDTLSNEEKKLYLKLLVSLSNLYDINLREELEKYVTYYKPTSKDKITQDLCLYYIENLSLENYENLKKEAIINKINFTELEEKVKIFLENLQTSVSKLGYNINKENFFKILNDYINKKEILTNEEKINYLTILLNLSKIYNINLRKQLKENIKNNQETFSLKTYNDPLDNFQLLKCLLFQRYNNGTFNPSEISTPDTKDSQFINEEYDFTLEQTELINRIIFIYLDKITNFVSDDLNPLYQDLLDHNDQNYLKNISISTLQEAIICLKKHQDINLPPHIKTFLKVLISATNYIDEIGYAEYNLFKTAPCQKDYSIYINTPNIKSTYIFLNEYIKECIIKNLNYDLQFFAYEPTSKHRTIIYASTKDLSSKLTILSKIDKKLTLSFGEPFQLASKMKTSYYSIALNPTYDLSYTEFLNSVLEVSYYRVLAKIVINQNIDPKELIILKNFMLLKNITLTEDKNPLNYLYNKTKFSIIKDIINKNIPNILNTLNLYMVEENYTSKLIIEFNKTILYLINITYSKDKNAKTNIALPNMT